MVNWSRNANSSGLRSSLRPMRCRLEFQKRIVLCSLSPRLMADRAGGIDINYCISAGDPGWSASEPARRGGTASLTNPQADHMN